MRTAQVSPAALRLAEGSNDSEHPARSTAPWAAAGNGAELIERLQRQDETAWRQVIDRFSPMVRKRSRDVGLQPEQCDDAVQETWLKLAASLESIKEPDRLAGWLSVTARNEAINVIRKNERIVLTDQLDESEWVGHEIDAGLSAELVASAVEAALGLLSERQRDVVRMRYLRASRPSYAEIAAQLQMPVGSIGPTLRRALQAMGSDPLVRALDDGCRLGRTEQVAA